MWISKKSLKKENDRLKNELNLIQQDLKDALKLKAEVIASNNKLAAAVESFMETYPLTLGETVYDVQLRSSKGRYTRTKASREHSVINEVIVDKKNYFNLVDRYIAKDVFKTLADAENHLNTICVE